MKTLKELYYTQTHEWVKFIDASTAYVGLTDYAQDSLGDLVYVNLPSVGDAVDSDEPFADVESVKAVSDVMSPVTGVVSETNDELLDAPEKINEDCYGAWLVKVSEINAKAQLLTADEYEEFVAEEAK